jgi:hypothetical protein
VLMLTACAAFLRRSSSALGLSSSPSLQFTTKQDCWWWSRAQSGSASVPLIRHLASYCRVDVGSPVALLRSDSCMAVRMGPQGLLLLYICPVLHA